MKTAFTMIELIFAIVVIAISVLTIPTMTQVNSQSHEDNIAQEAVFAASAKLTQILTHPWADNSMIVNPITLVKSNANILNINTVNPAYGATNVYGRYDRTAGVGAVTSNSRIGQIVTNDRRVFHSNDPVGNGDDYNGNELAVVGLDEISGTYAFTNAASGDNFGYKFEYQSVVTVGYISDTVTQVAGTNNYQAVLSNVIGVTPSNLKVISVAVNKSKTTPVTNVTTLYGYAANIGELASIYSAGVYP